MGKLRLPETETEYLNRVADVIELTTLKVLTELNMIRPYLKLREAYRKYGQSDVNRWIKEGLIHVQKDGDNNASVRIDRIQIEAVAKASNRATYLTTKER